MHACERERECGENACIDGSLGFGDKGWVYACEIEGECGDKHVSRVGWGVETIGGCMRVKVSANARKMHVSMVR